MINTKDDVRVLVVSASDKAYSVFHEFISDNTFTEMTRAVSIGEAKRLLLSYTYDIIIINAPLKDENGIDFAIDAVEDSPVGVIILISDEYYEQVSGEVSPYGVLTVSKPTNRQILYESARQGLPLRRMRDSERPKSKTQSSLPKWRKYAL